MFSTIVSIDPEGKEKAETEMGSWSQGLRQKPGSPAFSPLLESPGFTSLDIFYFFYFSYFFDI